MLMWRSDERRWADGEELEGLGVFVAGIAFVDRGHLENVRETTDDHVGIQLKERYFVFW